MTPYEKERAFEQLTTLTKLVVEHNLMNKERRECDEMALTVTHLISVTVGSDYYVDNFGEDISTMIDAVKVHDAKNDAERKRLLEAIEAKKAELNNLEFEFERRFPKNVNYAKSNG